MMTLIDADALKQDIADMRKRHCLSDNEEMEFSESDILGLIESATEATPCKSCAIVNVLEGMVRVWVRCIDCKHRDETDKHWCNWWMTAIDLCGFCYHGERRSSPGENCHE